MGNALVKNDQLTEFAKQYMKRVDGQALIPRDNPQLHFLRKINPALIRYLQKEVPCEAHDTESRGDLSSHYKTSCVLLL